jgi:hypothetical protein
VILIWRFLSLRYWWRHKGAFFLSALGVMLGLAVFVSIAVANNSVCPHSTLLWMRWQVKPTCKFAAGQNGLPESVFARTRHQQRRDAARQHQGAGATATTNALLADAGFFALSSWRRLVFRSLVFAISRRHRQHWTHPIPINYFAFCSTRVLLLSVKSWRSATSCDSAARITLFIGAQRKTFKVSTLLQGEGAGRAFGGDFALLDIATAQEAFGLVGRLSQIDLQVEEAKSRT